MTDALDRAEKLAAERYNHSRYTSRRESARYHAFIDGYLAAKAEDWEKHCEFTSELGFGDGKTEPAARYDDMLDPLKDALQTSLEHNECPVICEPCGEWMATQACEYCNGCGADVAASTAAMAYSECEWCAGVGKVHPGCAEMSYADLVEKAAEPVTVSAEQVEKGKDRARRVFGWRHIEHYLGQSPAWLDRVLDAIVRNAFRAAGFRIEGEGDD